MGDDPTSGPRCCHENRAHPISRGNQDADTPLNLNDTSIHRTEHGNWAVDAIWETPEEFTDSTYQVRLAEALPLLVEIISTVNSPTQSTRITTRGSLCGTHLHLDNYLNTAESALSST